MAQCDGRRGPCGQRSVAAGVAGGGGRGGQSLRGPSRAEQGSAAQQAPSLKAPPSPRGHGHQGADQTLGIQVDVFVIGVHFLAANFWAKNGDVYKPVDGKLIEPGHTASVHTALFTMRVDIALATSYPVVFLVESAPQSLPVLTMGHHGSFSESGWTGGTVVFQKGMSVGEASPPMKLDGASFRATRLDDTKDYTVFTITASPPNS